MKYSDKKIDNISEQFMGNIVSKVKCDECEKTLTIEELAKQMGAPNDEMICDKCDLILYGANAN